MSNTTKEIKADDILLDAGEFSKQECNVIWDALFDYAEQKKLDAQHYSCRIVEVDAKGNRTINEDCAMRSNDAAKAAELAYKMRKRFVTGI